MKRTRYDDGAAKDSPLNDSDRFDIAVRQIAGRGRFTKRSRQNQGNRKFHSGEKLRGVFAGVEWLTFRSHMLPNAV
jgi:hypothetical protein